MVALEDLYRPYRPKRRTRAMIAKETGTGAACGADSCTGGERTARAACGALRV